MAIWPREKKYASLSDVEFNTRSSYFEIKRPCDKKLLKDHVFIKKIVIIRFRTSGQALKAGFRKPRDFCMSLILLKNKIKPNHVLEHVFKQPHLNQFLKNIKLIPWKISTKNCFIPDEHVKLHIICLSFVQYFDVYYKWS